MTNELSITLVLREREPVAIQAVAESASDPRSANYGKFISREELRRLVAPSADELDRITAWATEHGLEMAGSADTQLLFFNGTEAVVDAAFGGDLGRFIRKEDHRGDRTLLALPREIAGWIEKVGGIAGARHQFGSTEADLLPPAEADTTFFADLPAVDRKVASPPFGLPGLTPADVAEIYGFPPHLDGSGETIALLMLGGGVSKDDLEAFWTSHGIVPPEVAVVNIGPKSERPAHPLETFEAVTSIEWAGAMAPGAKLVIYFVDPTVMGDPWAAFLLALISDTEHAPSIASISWVTPERQYYRTHGHTLVAGLLEQCTALGITVIAAAGDWGSFDGVPRAICDGRPVGDAPWPHGIFPAVEERVLGVGGTMITMRDPLTEIAWSGPPPPAMRRAIHMDKLAGSGGFSADVAVPWWQQPILRSSYPRGAGAPAVVPYGRGFPDVALAASGPAVQRTRGGPLTAIGYQAVVLGRWIDFAGGTSLGAPIWASIIARVNQARRDAGLPRVGFVNPALYELAQRADKPFREIGEGASDVIMNVVNSAGKAVSFELPGYECQRMWDPVTGLGVPDVAALVDALVALGTEARGDPSR